MKLTIYEQRVRPLLRLHAPSAVPVLIAEAAPLFVEDTSLAPILAIPQNKLELSALTAVRASASDARSEYEPAGILDFVDVVGAGERCITERTCLA